MAVRANKPAFNIREKLKELTHSIGLKGRELMGAATVQEARDLVSAGRKNLIHNGDFRIDQRGGTHTTVTNYHLDRWKFQRDGLAEYTHSVTSSTDAPNGFSKSLRLEVTSTETSGVSSTEDLSLTQELEGQDLQLLAAGTSPAKPFTLSFWVKSTKPGVYCVSVVADPTSGNKIFSTTYKINSASVWEYKTVNIPPCTLTTLRNDNGRGMSVRWVTIAGAGYTGATTGNLHQWSNYHSSLFAGGHETQLITDGDVWQITGIQLEVGKNATEFEHRSYGEELALCQRYFYRHATFTNGVGRGIGNANRYTSPTAFGVVHFPVTMRALPTLDVTNTTNGFQFYSAGSGQDFNTFSQQETNYNTFTLECSGLSGTGGLGGWWRTNPAAGSNSSVSFSAEL